MSQILARAQWTSRPNGRAGRPLDKTKVVGIAVHYPAAGKKKLASLTKSEVAERLRGWRRLHLSKGWADIGYNYAIDGSGRIWDLTGLNVGAHANAGNPTHVGVLFVLGDGEPPPQAAIDSFLSLRAWILDRLPYATKVHGHQEIPSNATACPGKPLMKLINAGTLTQAAPPETSDSDQQYVNVARLEAAYRAGRLHLWINKADVRILQARVGAKVDGCYGANTRARVAIKQRYYNDLPGHPQLPENGRPTNQTLKSLGFTTT